MMLTFQEFHERICNGYYSDDEEWRREVGYRPDDKDGGFRRWLELTVSKEADFLHEFKRAVYRDCTPKAPLKIKAPMQLQWEMYLTPL